MDSELVFKAVHGSWGGWGDWSQCSVSCGQGVQHSDRMCNSPV